MPSIEIQHKTFLTLLILLICLQTAAAVTQECKTGTQTMQKYGLDRVLLTWETSEINETTCEFYACDAVQTSIMLFKRITTSNTGEIDAFLIKDNYSEKFKQDFSLHYGSVFYSSKEMRISNCINNKQR